MTFEIVTSHWKEDLGWLLKSPWPVNLIDKEGADLSPFVPKYIIPNKGKESSAYIKYIVENYENLPDHVAFIHGHETAYHQCHDRPLLEVIAGAQREIHDFISLNNYFRLYHFLDETDNWMKIETYWNLFGFKEKDKPVYGCRLEAPMGAQFIVSREAIRRYPKQDWNRWYNLVMNEGTDYFPLFLENIWHIIFGQPYRCGPNPRWFSFPVKMDMYWHEYHKTFPPSELAEKGFKIELKYIFTEP
jgi:hypothetical protein